MEGKGREGGKQGGVSCKGTSREGTGPEPELDCNIDIEIMLSFVIGPVAGWRGRNRFFGFTAVGA